MDYHSIVWLRSAASLISLALLPGFPPAQAQETPKDPAPKAEPRYDDTFSGPIVDLSSERITVSRSILGKPAEKRSFWIKSDTRIEGKLRLKIKVTVGFITTDEGDIARLIVVRANTPKK
jgi:hypothetical protein